MRTWKNVGILLFTCTVAASTIGACSDENGGGATGGGGAGTGTGATMPQLCDTDAVCPSGQQCCMATADATTGVCQVSCDCFEDADCDNLPDDTFEFCCEGTCFSVAGDNCVSDLDCADPNDGCVFANADDCVGTCTPKGTSGPSVAAHMVIEGDATTDRSGCVVSGGMGAVPAILLLDDPQAGPATITVAGTIAPIANGMGVEAGALVQLCTNATYDGTVTGDCHRARLSYNALSNEGHIGILDTSFNEVEGAPWTPSQPTHDYEMTVTTNPENEAYQVVLSIDDVPVTNLNATMLGIPGGDRIALLLNQASVCDLRVE